MTADSIFSGPITKYDFNSVRFGENPFMNYCEKEKKKALLGFSISHFHWLFSNDIMAVKGLKQAALLQTFHTPRFLLLAERLKFLFTSFLGYSPFQPFLRHTPRLSRRAHDSCGNTPTDSAARNERSRAKAKQLFHSRKWLLSTRRRSPRWIALPSTPSTAAKLI